MAPRVQGDNERPEIQIKPRFDLAADLGVTTSALSQTIRIATIGDIEQNSAKFSLADRQVPIIVSLPLSSRRDLDILDAAGVAHAGVGTGFPGSRGAPRLVVRPSRPRRPAWRLPP